MGIFRNCADPSLKTLQSFGYNVVQLPRVDLLPTQLLVANGDRLQRLGELLSVFVPAPDGAPAPPIKPDKPGPNISGTKSNEIDAGVGLNILGGLISALGGSTLGINLAFAKASTIHFEFTATLENSTEVALVDQFIASSKVSPFARAAAEMLENDKVYVVTSTIKSNKIVVGARDSNKQAIDVDVPVIKGAIGGSIKVGREAEGSTLVGFEGAVPLVFGFQAVQLIFDKGQYRTMKLVDAGGVVAEGAAAAPLMLDVGTMLSGGG